MFAQIKKDIDSIMLRDPAAKTRLEAALCYPGLHAIWLHRIAHHFYLKGWVVFPRLINTFSRFLTGIDIHPGAKLGPGLFIDHGMGVIRVVVKDAANPEILIVAIFHIHLVGILFIQPDFFLPDMTAFP